MADNISYSNDGSRYTVRDSSGKVTGTYDAKTGGGLAGTTKPNSGNSAYDNWVGAQTNTNSRFDPNNYQTDANGARYTPGYSAPVTTNAYANASALGTTTPGRSGVASVNSSNDSVGGGYTGNPGGTTQLGVANNTASGGNSAYPQSSISSQLEQLKQAQLAATMAGLDKSKNASLSNLSAEKATIEPLYQKEKMQAGVVKKQNARTFAEYMAQKGGGAGASGIGAQGELLNNMAYQKQYGELGQAETGALTENARRVTDVGNAYNSDVQGANAGVEAQYLQNVIAQQDKDRNYGLQLQQINNQASQFAQSFGLSQQQFANTINQQGVQNAMQDKQFAQSVDQFAQQMGLSKDQYASSLDQWAKTFNQSVKQNDVQNNQWTQSFWQNQSQFDASQYQNNNQFTQSLDFQKAQLAAEQRNQALNRAASAARASTPKPPTAAQIKAGLSADAFGDVDNAFNQGTSWETMSSKIIGNQSGYASVGLDYKPILDYAKAKYDASWNEWNATQPNVAESRANALTNSAFKNW